MWIANTCKPNTRFYYLNLVCARVLPEPYPRSDGAQIISVETPEVGSFPTHHCAVYWSIWDLSLKKNILLLALLDLCLWCLASRHPTKVVGLPKGIRVRLTSETNGTKKWTYGGDQSIRLGLGRVFQSSKCQWYEMSSFLCFCRFCWAECKVILLECFLYLFAI